VDIEGVVAKLGTTFSPDEAAIAETVLHTLHGTIPDRQLSSRRSG
jgi:hypothetical protein